MSSSIDVCYRNVSTERLQEYFSGRKITNGMKNAIFVNVSKDGNLDSMKWLIEQGGVDIHARSEYVFRNVCSNGYFEVACWLFAFDNTINIHANDEEAFVKCCVNGHLEIAKWLYSLCEMHECGSVNVHVNDEEAFRHSCLNGHLEVAQWLYSLSVLDRVNIYILNNDAFKKSCMNGHAGVVKWLYNLDKHVKKIDLHMLSEYLYKYSYERRHIDMLEWLCTVDKSFSINFDAIFIELCETGEMELLKKIYKLNILKKYTFPNAFFSSCIYGHINIAKWIYSIDKFDIRIHDDQEFIDACTSGHIELAKWLASICKNYVLQVGFSEEHREIIVAFKVIELKWFNEPEKLCFLF